MKLPAILLAALALSGCGGLQPHLTTPMKFYQQQINAEFSTAAWLQSYHALPETTPEQITFKVSERNRLINEQLDEVDTVYHAFVGRFYGSVAKQGIAVDWAGIGINGAATFTGNAGTKAILAAAAGALIAGNASWNAREFNSQSRSAIVMQMDASRADWLNVIEGGMGLPLSQYPLEQGLRDVQSYWSAGTVLDALQAISLKSGAQLTAARTARMARREAHEGPR